MRGLASTPGVEHREDTTLTNQRLGEPLQIRPVTRPVYWPWLVAFAVVAIAGGFWIMRGDPPTPPTVLRVTDVQPEAARQIVLDAYKALDELSDRPVGEWEYREGEFVTLAVAACRTLEARGVSGLVDWVRGDDVQVAAAAAGIASLCPQWELDIVGVMD